MEELVKDLLKELSIDATPEECKELENDLEERFNQVTLDTMLENLTDSQKSELEEDIKVGNTELLEQKIASLSVEIPNLKDKIDQAIEFEVNLIRLAFKGNPEKSA